MIGPRWLVDVGIAVVILGVGYAAGHWIMEQVREEGRAELRAENEQLRGELERQRIDRSRAESATAKYLAELEVLRRAARTRSVRLCVSTSAVRAGEPAARADEPAAAAGVGDGAARSNPQAWQPGADIGRDLFDLAAQCDAEIARLRALQGWVRDGL